MIEYLCGHCRQPLQAPEEFTGNMRGCTRCGHRQRLALPKGPKTVCPNPNCGYAGPAAIIARGSVSTAFLLCLAGILPGLLYALLAMGQSYHCPRCGVEIRLAGRR